MIEFVIDVDQIKRYFNNSLKINYFNIEEFIDENSIKKIEKIISKTDKKIL